MKEEPMKVLKWCFLFALVYGCAFTSAKPKSWEAPEVSYNGTFSNYGEVDPESAGRGHTPRKLAWFFWPEDLPADKVRLLVSDNNILVELIDGTNVVKQGAFPLTNGVLIIKTERKHKEGGGYQDQDVVCRNQKGLIIESKTSGWSPAFIVPIIYSEQTWYFFPAMN
jgi:hypothetical protein